MNIEFLYEKFLECNQKISTDTRHEIEGSLFFAWKGLELNGNRFAKLALEKGARYVVVDDLEFYIDSDDRYIFAPDSIRALQDLALFHRNKFSIPVFALTGSNGKTTTKELISTILSSEKNIIFTEGNLNNHVGVPKTLLRINTETEIAVVEMGANHLGEIEQLCRIARPSHGLITNIGRAHIGLFGGEENIFRAKTELYRFLEKNSATVFVNGKDKKLSLAAQADEKISYLAEESDFPLLSLNTLPKVSVRFDNLDIQTNLTGEYNLMNIAAAIAVGKYFKISNSSIKNALESYYPDNSRSQIVEGSGSNTYIKDYYNANRSSMEHAIENFSLIETDKHKISILGDMFELGDYEFEDHEFIIDSVHSKFFDRNIFVGEIFYKQRDLKKGEFYRSTKELMKALEKENIENSFILLKASNSMKFSEIFDTNILV